MSDKTIELIELLKEGKTCNDICDILNITNKQLYHFLTILRNKGFLYGRKYFSNGNILYKSMNSVKDIKDNSVCNQNSVITTFSDENNIKCLAISDLHFGNSLERLDLIEEAFNYCINNDIHIIICGGDMLDGTFSKESQTITDPHLQVEHFIKNYPFDKNILTFAVCGDHDHSVLSNGFQDIMEITKNYRHDIIVGGYNNLVLNIKNDSILLFHHYDNGAIFKTNSPIIMHGHAHKYSICFSDNDVLNVTIPSLSDINEAVPSALELELEFKKGFINFINIKQLCFLDKIINMGENRFDLLKNRNVTYSPIDNISPQKLSDTKVSISKKLEKIKNRYNYQ